MHGTLLLPVLALAAASQSARAAPPAAAGFDAPAARAAPAGEGAIVVPLYVVDGRYVTDLRVGSTTLRTHVDTGGVGAVGVFPPALARLTVEYTGATSARTDGAGQRWVGRAFVIPSLRFGDATFTRVPGYERREAADGNFGGRAPYDAVVGRDLLERYTVVVDYPQRRLELHPREAGPRVCTGAHTTLFRLARGFWASEVVTDHGSLILVWDTGATGASFVKDRVAASLSLPLRDGAYGTARFAIGEADLGPTALRPLKIGGALDADGMIGSDVFARHRVCFDLQRGIVSTG
jgi:hypothetical protein